MKFPLIGLHILDYFTYLPPRGSCGLAAYIEALKSAPSQVKLLFIYVTIKLWKLLKKSYIIYQNVLHLISFH